MNRLAGELLLLFTGVPVFSNFNQGTSLRLALVLFCFLNFGLGESVK